MPMQAGLRDLGVARMTAIFGDAPWLVFATLIAVAAALVLRQASH